MLVNSLNNKKYQIYMANHISAKKRIRQTLAKTVVNNQRRSKVRTAIRKTYDAIANKDKDLSLSSFKTAESEIMRAVSKGVIKKPTASRKVSRISKLIKKSFS